MFVVCLEIPLFHVMNACVTFGNIFGLDEAVHGISAIQEEDRLSCAIDESCFQVPSDYSVYGITFICFFASLLARLSESESRPPPSFSHD